MSRAAGRAVCMDNRLFIQGVEMFIGRQKELDSLTQLYEKGGFHMTVVTGRRRVGKSTLLAEFIKEKKAVYYTASKVGADRNLELLTEQVISALEPSISGARFSTCEALFDFMTDRLSEETLVFVIDELPYWAENDEALLSVLQKYIDTKWKDRNLFLILCGSSLSFMESRVLSEKSPLFGRRDSQIRLEPFHYLEAALFVPSYTLEEKAICYGITGGVAKYLSLLDPDASLDENIQRLFFSTDGYLYDEPRNFLAQEFSETALVNNVIEQIAWGENSLHLIADKVHERESTVLYSLGKLISVGLVEKKTCITEEKNRKKTQYVLKDSMFRFWYRFVSKAVSMIEIGRGGAWYERAVKPELHEFMGSIFEQMCREYVLANGESDRFGCFITQTGTWWGTETVDDGQGRKISQTADVDVVGLSSVDKALVAGECKFRNRPLDKSVYEALVRRSKVIPTKYRVLKYLLFSLGGFTEWFDNIDRNMVQLYTLEDLYAID